MLLLAFPDLDNGSDKLDQKVGDSQKGGVEVVQEVDKETLNVRSIVVL